MILAHLIYMCKQALELNNLQLLICHKTKPNFSPNTIVYSYKHISSIVNNDGQDMLYKWNRLWTHLSPSYGWYCIVSVFDDGFDIKLPKKIDKQLNNETQSDITDKIK